MKHSLLEHSRHQHKILIVEDDTKTQQEYQKAFTAAGFEVKISSEGMDGIVQVVEFRPDIILLDLMMPDVNGYEFISAIRNNSDIEVIIVVCSNFSQGHYVQEALEKGANEFLDKAKYSPAQIVRRAERILHKQEK